jgi:hypothetical protein
MQPTRQHRSIRRQLVAIAGAGVLAAGVLAAAPAYAADPVPGPQGIDEVMKSDNVELLANRPRPQGLENLNSDLAFQGDYAFAGNYNGFSIWDISDPSDTELVSAVVCPGSQNDVSVYGDLLFLSTDSSRSDDSCQSTSQSVANPDSWEGIKIFDVSDKGNPRYIKAIETDCGSHTHSLAPAEDLEAVYVYVSSYDINDTTAYPDCAAPHDKLSIIKVPVSTPTSAELVADPVVFPDGGNPTGNYSRRTAGCHDLTTFASRGVMAGACMGDGVLFDITDRENPTIIDSVRDTENFAFWHSATFNNAGTKVVYTDELGGGSGARCRLQEWPDLGANAIYDIEGGDELVFKSYYKIPRIQRDNENCVAHNGSLIPVKGKDIMVQAWYQGGLSVWDFTDSENPVELGFYDRGPAAENLILSGNWSTYWYNGHLFSNEITRGFDSYSLSGSEWDQAKTVQQTENNPQMQQLYVEAISFDNLRDLIEDADITASVRAGLLNRLDRTEAQAAKGSELGAYTSLAQLIDRANNQIKGGMSTTDRDAIVAAAQAFHDDIKAADHYER